MMTSKTISFVLSFPATAGRQLQLLDTMDQAFIDSLKRSLLQTMPPGLTMDNLVITQGDKPRTVKVTIVAFTEIKDVSVDNVVESVAAPDFLSNLESGLGIKVGLDEPPKVHDRVVPAPSPPPLSPPSPPPFGFQALTRVVSGLSDTAFYMIVVCGGLIVVTVAIVTTVNCRKRGVCRVRRIVSVQGSTRRPGQTLQDEPVRAEPTRGVVLRTRDVRLVDVTGTSSRASRAAVERGESAMAAQAAHKLTSRLDSAQQALDDARELAQSLSPRSGRSSPRASASIAEDEGKLRF